MPHDEFVKTRDSLKDVKIILTKWVDKKDMTDDEKENISVWKGIGGYLKRFSYKEAWANWWNTATQDQKNWILNIKQFNAEIFKGITGIDVSIPKSSMKGKTVKVEFDGQSYEAIIQ